MPLGDSSSPDSLPYLFLHDFIIFKYLLSFMKKFLLSLALVLGLASSASADVVDVLNYASLGLKAQSTSYAEHTVSSTNSGASYALQCAVPTDILQFRSSNSNSGVVSTTSGGILKSVKITYVGGDKNTKDRKINVYGSTKAFTDNKPSALYASDDNKDAPTALTNDELKYDGTKTEYTYTFPEGSEYTYIGLRSNSGAIYLTSIEITYTADAPAVSLPTISFDYDNKVTISHTDADVAIYYTTNGDTPTTESQLYTEPFEVTEAATIKAIATKGSDKSAVASKDVTPYVTYDGFDAMLKANPAKTTDFIISGPLTVAYQYDRYTYVKDAADDWMLIFSYANAGLVPQSLVNGDQLGRFIGKYTPYNGLPEIAPSAVLEKIEATSPIEPSESPIEEINTSTYNQFVQITDVTIAAGADANNFTFSDETKEIHAYNQFGLTITPGTGFTVTGFTGVAADGTFQILPTVIDATNATLACFAPTFSKASGSTLVAGTTVTLTSATEGASIYYTLDGTEPTSASTLYEAPIAVNESLTIKAIAVKEGFLDSEVATASYIVPVVATPVITLGYDNKVTITTTTEGAAIYYTLDATEPTAESTAYTEPFEVTANGTVKAIAVKGDASSSVASKSVQLYTIYDDFATAETSAGTNPFVVNGPLTVVYQSGSYTYVKDASESIALIYSTNSLVPQSLVNGEQIGAFYGKLSSYNSLTQFVPSAAIEKLTTTVDPIEPQEDFELANIDPEKCNLYVKVAGAKIAATSSAKSFTITDANNSTATLYNQFSIDIPVGDNLTVYGITGRYNSGAQLYPVFIDQSAATIACETPTFSVVPGLVVSGTTVEISTETEDATIFYTLDGTEPDINSTQYTEPIALTEDVTIKAIAAKENYYNSAVASAAYTVLPANSSLAQFNFTDVSSLSIAGDIDQTKLASAGTYVEIPKLSPTTAAAKMTFGGSATTSTRLYNYNGTTELRIYKSATLTISANNDGEYINSMELTTSSSFAATVDKGTYANNKWEAKDADGKPVAATSVTFTLTANSRLSTLNVVLGSDPTAVSNIAVDNTDNAPVEYYNLQGVRVLNPSNGLYIARQGGKSYKIILK
jgi:hypothetical protein